jgi:hypothetical protein
MLPFRCENALKQKQVGIIKILKKIIEILNYSITKYSKKNFGGAFSRRLVRPSAFLVRGITFEQQEVST